jgi:hypothetical protein
VANSTIFPRSRFDSQHTQSGSQPSVTSVPGKLKPSSGLQVALWHTSIHAGKTFNHSKQKKKKKKKKKTQRLRWWYTGGGGELNCTGDQAAQKGVSSVEDRVPLGVLLKRTDLSPGLRPHTC